jgi:hypothetical protein
MKQADIVELVPAPIQPAATPPVTPFKPAGLGLFFGLIAGALLIVTLTGGALSWDGSYILYKLVDSKEPFVVHSRWYVIPLQLPALLASLFTHDLTVLQTLFSLTYTAIPLIALGLSWLVVRRQHPALFIWAVFGIGLGTLPGQFSFVNDANVAIQLCWPLLLAVLTGLPRRQLPIVLGVSVILLVTHPEAVVFFALLAGLCGLLAILRAEGAPRRHLLIWAAILAGFSGLTVLKFLIFHTEYETDQLTIDTLLDHFQAAVWGLPLAAIGCSWLAGLALFLRSQLKNSVAAKICGVTELAALLATGLLLFIWARDPHFWERAIDFRTWELASSMPFMGLATFDSFRKPERHTTIQWNHQLLAGRMIALIFLVVLAVQSTTWFSMTQRVQETLETSPTACINIASIKWLGRIPVGHWSITPYSLWLGGEQPTHIIASGYQCDDSRLAQQVGITSWDWQPWDQEQLDLSLLKQKINLEMKR